MSRPPILISELKPDQKFWKIAIRVIDVWDGDQIHVVTRSRDFELWKKTLQEMQTYIVYNGETMINEMHMKVCDNKYKVFFNRATTVTAVDVLDIPEHSFNFKSFSDFLSGEFIVDRLYDIIGVVQHVARTQVAGAGKKACVNLTLGAEMDVTLWEGYASQFMNYKAESGHVFLILTHAWCQVSSSNGKLNISNAWSGSKLLLNHDHPHVEEFKTKFLDFNQEQTATHTFSLNSCSQGAVDDMAFSFTKDVISIADMTTLTEETYCNTVGKTMRFRANPFGWFYELCPTCNKTNSSPGNPFRCKCSDNNSVPITKYKIEIEVEHDSKTVNFVFWDKECIPFVGMSAHALRQLMKKTNEDHPLIYPEHLDHLLGKDFDFRAKY
ncbi:uncharacterized protein LOC131635113 [Vicia villosa]|uniref:uncharacterized protein LOC131635113 n=1 Tax=Vicia villosa TaxID=3911 RepID=UPI00273B171E|nr:uncharacterized protein LOC131635113 [Vicia villosa]